jgi:phage-related protein
MATKVAIFLFAKLYSLHLMENDMIFDSDFMRLYEELSLLNEAKNKKGASRPKSNQKDLSLDVQKVLAANQLISITEAFGIKKSTSDTGWTFLVPANKISDFRKQTVEFDTLLENKIKSIAEQVTSTGRPRYAKEPIQNNGGRTIIELDFGTHKDRNQWRGLGFTVSCGEYKYFIIGHIFTKKRQKINADDLEVKAANRIYDAVLPEFKKLSKS